MLRDDWSWYIKSNMCFPKTEVSQPAMVVIVGHSVTDSFCGSRRGFSNYCAKLFQFTLHFFWSGCNVSVYVFWF